MAFFPELKQIRPKDAKFHFGSYTPYEAWECEGFRVNPPLFGKQKMLWIQYLYCFPNGFGASVVRNFMSRGNGAGLFEVAVLRGGQLWYESEITDDVIGGLTIDEVVLVLADIESLDKDGKLPMAGERK